MLIAVEQTQKLNTEVFAMLTQDILPLTAGERRVLLDSFHEGISPRRVRGVVLSALIVLVGVVLFVSFGAGQAFLAGLTIVTVVISASEKFAYQRSMLRYESLIRKLVNRVESLEDVPASPMIPAESPPAIRVSDAVKRRAS
jgi:hypothetical protein